MTEAFTGTPDLRPFDALPETRSETERNGTAAYHARVNARLDLSREDAFPEAEMNDEIWHAVTGRAAPARPASDIATR